MSFVRLSLSLFGTVAVASAVLASATIWLLITDPVTVADAVESGQVSPLVQALAGVLYDAFKGILRYLKPAARPRRPGSGPKHNHVSSFLEKVVFWT